MAGRNVDALAKRAGQLGLTDSPTSLGEGGFAKVYKETRTLGKETMTVAVKKIKNFDMEDAVKEVETLMKLDHKYIIKYYGHHLEDNGRTLCIVLEFADRGTFRDVTTEEAQKPGSNWFKEWAIWRGLSHLTDALNYLHTLPQPILHRDLKPDNILGVTNPENGNIWLKLADFGLVKLLDENTQGDFYAQSFCGTRTYMAPEVWAMAQVWTNHKGYTFSADIWSLGCIMSFLCNRGEDLFQGTRFLQKMKEWRGLPQGTIKGYSSDLVALIGRMLHPDHHARPSAKEIRAECTAARMAEN